MKVILYMAMTANGLIAKTDDDTAWISKEEWNSYSNTVQAAGNVILGHRTYQIITKQPEFAELKDVKIVVLSFQDFKTLSPNHSVVHSPKEALELLKNFKTVIIAGGGMLNASFFAENLVDEIYLDIEPTLLGKGIPLCNGSDFERQLKLIDSKKISDNEIQLHYKVKR